MYTPMIQQYLAIKKQYKDSFLFFRLGDFYEMFFEDAIQASQELEITLTGRDGGSSEKIPMCGVPHHAAANYIEQLVEKGYKVAVCEQVEDPKVAKGVVRREVVQLITPGTLMEGKTIRDKQNNYIVTISIFAENTIGFAYTDISTGENRVTILTRQEDVMSELYSIGAKEVVVSSNFPSNWLKSLQERYHFTVSIEDETEATMFSDMLACITKPYVKETMSRLLVYLHKTQKRSLDHLQKPHLYYTNEFMKIDLFSKRNLEITETIRSKGKKGSLLWLLDETVTAMGGRLLKQWLDRPLISEEKIEKRHNIVSIFLNDYFHRHELRELLKSIYDLERLVGRVAFGNVNARDLIQLKKSLQQIPIVKNVLLAMETPMQKIAQNMDDCSELVNLLERAIQDNPPISVKDGSMIKDGYNEKLDTFRDASRNGKTWLASLEQKERERTGIKTLKIGYNRIFGYYIEVTKANISALPEGLYERKQTLANAERYITPELKEKETLILEAEERSVELEYEIFLAIREQVKVFIPRLQKLATVVSTLDVLQCFATISEERHYVKPEFQQTRELIIEAGRHPVIEKVLGTQTYVDNDCLMNESREVFLITGPNMSGKSTYMRQIALTAILAQIGCFVPAKRAVLPMFDQVFTRIGAADDLVSGQSTFMVEMMEARNAVVYATQNSLILFDEIGRGTSTYDGMALAQAIIEYVHDRIGAKTLFSTHYHELTDLDKQLSRLKNVHVKAAEENGQVVFLHKVEDGAADESYGIHVAKLANMPEEIISRANTILLELEKTVTEIAISTETPKDTAVVCEQMAMFTDTTEKEIAEELRNLNVLEMTPMDAMNTLYKLQKKAR